jgi:hypothetical protein
MKNFFLSGFYFFITNFIFLFRVLTMYEEYLCLGIIIIQIIVGRLYQSNLLLQGICTIGLIDFAFYSLYLTDVMFAIIICLISVFLTISKYIQNRRDQIDVLQ